MQTHPLRRQLSHDAPPRSRDAVQDSEVRSNRSRRDAEDLLCLERVRAGDATALGQLYGRYSAVARTIAFKTLRHREEAEDVVQDVFLAIADRSHQFRPERGSLFGWLVIAVRNLALDRLRRCTRRMKIVAEHLAHEPAPRVADPEFFCWRSRERHAIAHALETLAPGDRAALAAAFFDGCSYAEIAVAERIPVGTVKSRIARALTVLGSALCPSGQVGRRARPHLSCVVEDHARRFERRCA